MSSGATMVNHSGSSKPNARNAIHVRKAKSKALCRLPREAVRPRPVIFYSNGYEHHVLG